MLEDELFQDDTVRRSILKVNKISFNVKSPGAIAEPQYVSLNHSNALLKVFSNL